jgi:ribonuclease VapC
VIVDSSVIIAIATDEPGSELYAETLLASRLRRGSAATLLEAAIVIDRHPSPLAAAKFDQLVERFRFVVEPFTASQAIIARDAYKQFGKGSGHPAQLNFGDCFTYALAKELGEPLLFIGQDFVHTGVRRVLS